MKFCGTELRPDGYEYAVEFEAADWAEAEKVCNENGWNLDGELVASIEATDEFGMKEADQLIEALSEAKSFSDKGRLN